MMTYRGYQKLIGNVESLEEFLDDVVEALIERDGDEVVEITIANQKITVDSGFDEVGWPETRRFRVYDNVVKQICAELGERDVDGIFDAVKWTGSVVSIDDRYLA